MSDPGRTVAYEVQVHEEEAAVEADNRATQAAASGDWDEANRAADEANEHYENATNLEEARE